MKAISVKEYIDLFNQKIKMTEGYKSGMRVYLVPTEITSTGWDYEPLDNDTKKVVLIAKKELEKEYFCKNIRHYDESAE